MTSVLLERNPAATNPLRKWRESRKPRVTINRAASLLRVSSTTVKEWEQGSLTPKPVNFAAVAGLLKVSVPDLREAWDRWLRRIAVA